MATRWRMPPESSLGSASAKSLRPTTPSSSATRSRRSARGQRPTSSPKATFSATVFHGYSE